MSGKATLVLVLAFAALIALFSRSSLNYSVETVENIVGYHNSTQSKHLAVSAANLALTKLFNDPNYRSTMNSPMSGIGNAKATFRTLANQKVEIEAVGTYGNKSDTVRVVMAPVRSFSYYGQFYSTEGAGWWTPGTFRSPYHNNGRLKLTGGSHTFKMPASCTNGLSISNLGFGAPNNIFEQGFRSGVNIPLTFDPAPIANAGLIGGKVFKDSTASNAIAVKLKFKDDATVDYTYKFTTGPPAGQVWKPEVNISVTDLAPNGVIIIQRGDAYVEGVLDGQLTIYARRIGQGGNIYLPNSITYKVNPNTKVDGQYVSDDVLGLITDKELVMMYDPARTGCNVHAAVFVGGGTHKFPNYNLYAPPISFRVIGGVACTSLQITANLGWVSPGVWGVINGVGIGISPDPRFYLDNPVVPPFFPYTNELKMFSWYE
jgi:hypothetical protein